MRFQGIPRRLYLFVLTALSKYLRLGLFRWIPPQPRGPGTSSRDEGGSIVLTAIEVKYAGPGRHSDGRGLYLFVRPSGSKSWVLRSHVDGRRRDLGLGSACKVSLAQARAMAAELRAQIKRGEDARAPGLRGKRHVPTFAGAARDCHQALKAGWRNKRHRDSWLTSLETHIFPHFGELPVDAITSLMVRDALVPTWLKIPETARRNLQRIDTVLDYAHLSGWRQQEISLRAVPKGLPRQPVEENHFVAMPYEEVPAFVARLTSMAPSAGRDALLFTIHTASRSGETRYATWSEIDLDAGIWSIPASRMKMRKTHVVPLTGPVIEILRRRWPLRNEESDLIFSTYGIKPLSDMAMTQFLRRIGIEKVTVHGFRSSFTDWAAELTDFRKEVVDKALAHKLADRVEAAYRRTDFFERRRALMLAWSNYLIGKRTARRRRGQPQWRFPKGALVGISAANDDQNSGYGIGS